MLERVAGDRYVCSKLAGGGERGGVDTVCWHCDRCAAIKLCGDWKTGRLEDWKVPR